MEMEMEYKSGAYFGENEFLGMGRQRTCSVRARTFCEVSTLHPDDMEPVLNVHLRLRRRLERYAKMKTAMESRMMRSGDAANEMLMEAMKAEIEAGWQEEGIELREAFDTFDKDKSGFLERDEIAHLARYMGQSLQDWQIDEALRMMDTDGSGSVDFEEFSDWWQASDARLDFSGRGDNVTKTMRSIQENVLKNQLELAARVEKMENKVNEEFAFIRQALTQLSKR